MFDVSLLTTVGLILLVSLIGSYLRSRRTDPCLKSFEGFHVTLERTDGKTIWGILELESTGFELHYRSDVERDQHIESSYVFYADEYDTIQALFRYADDLTEANQRKRAQDIRRAFHPSPLRRGQREVRKFISTASDSLSEVIGLLVGRARKPVGRYITDTSESYLSQLGSNLIGHAGSAFDPLLERFIGQKVVVDLMEGEEIHEHVGIFHQYSADFLEILDVQFPHKERIELGPDGCDGSGCVRVDVAPGSVEVYNPDDHPVLLQRLCADGEEQLLEVVVDGGRSVEFVPELPLDGAELRVRAVRTLDMVVPRTRCLVRHRAERVGSELLTDIVFDVGILLDPDRRDAERERRLRHQLEQNVGAAVAAAHLGGLLLKRQAYQEAERWLRHALRLRYSLPDNGRRVAMQLRELERRLAGDGQGTVAGSMARRERRDGAQNALPPPMLDAEASPPAVAGRAQELSGRGRQALEPPAS